MSQPDSANHERNAAPDVRNAVLCGLAIVVAVALTLPISQSAFNDDWSYSRTVQRLHETGGLTYNGWASASLIAQAYWGLLWVKVFDFSPLVLRMSTLPLAAAAISLCYLLGRHAGLRPVFASFTTLMVGLSPLYLPVASSFMTDAPGLFCIFLSMYLLLRSIESPQSSSAILWLITGLFVGLIGGTGRQIVWVVPLVFTPYAAWLRRDNLRYVFCAVIGWIIVFAGALLTLRWFNHQPYSIPEAPLRYTFKLAMGKKGHFALSLLSIPLTMIWMILPALWGLLRGWTSNRALLALIILLGPILILGKVRPRYLVAPWMGNTLAYQGVMGGAELHGERAVVLPRALRIMTAVVVFTVGSILTADILIWLARPFTAWRKTLQFLLYPDRGRTLLPAMILFSLAYFALLTPRCAADMAYDRYILPIMPCVVFPLMLQAQKRGDVKVPTIAWIVLGFFTLYAIVITQEVTALGRAREAAANRLIAAGARRTEIDAGFEYDFQTQILTRGYVNDPRILTPRHAWDKRVGPTPSLVPRYRLEFAPAPDTRPTPFGWVDYFTYLYPFHRRIYIDTFTDPWWLDPSKAATRPKDIRYQIMSPTGSTDDSASD